MGTRLRPRGARESCGNSLVGDDLFEAWLIEAEERDNASLLSISMVLGGWVGVSSSLPSGSEASWAESALRFLCFMLGVLRDGAMSSLIDLDPDSEVGGERG